MEKPLHYDPKGGNLFNPREYTAMSRGMNFTKEQTEYQLFPEEYFAAADCSVYFNDVWMDELTGLNFSLTESVHPLFAYGSKIWDNMARGNRIVHGEFRIAFKEAGYLWVILDHIAHQRKKSPAIGYLMQGEEIPIWHGQIQQNIEEILYFWHAEGQKMPDREEVYYTERKEKWLYKWPKIKKSNNGKANSMRMWKNKGYNTGESRAGDSDKGNKMSKQTDAIKQLQQRLIALGYGWKPWSIDIPNYYSGDRWHLRGLPSKGAKSGGVPYSNQLPDAAIKYVNDRVSKKIGRKTGKWKMLMRYNRNENTLGGPSKNYGSWYEIQFQKRLREYPGGLDELRTGGEYDEDYDGRYGDKFVKAIEFFNRLAERNDGSRGYYLSTENYNEIKKGLVVNGEYDLPTKLAVIAFQRKHGIYADGYVDYQTMYAMAPYRTVKDKHTRMVPGEMHKDLNSLSENRFSMYEKEVWGRPMHKDAEKVRNTESFFYRGRMDKDGSIAQEWLYQNGIDLYINYGPLAENLVNRHGNAPDRTKKKDGWYPDGKPANIGKAINFNTTVKAIRNCQIYNVSQVIDPLTGNPIEEVYQFIARDLD